MRRSNRLSLALALFALVALAPTTVMAATIPQDPFDHPGSFSMAGRGRINYAQPTTFANGSSACASLQYRLSTASYPISFAVEYPANGATPAFCDIQGTINGTEAYEIALPDAWNGRMYMWGNGGWAGETMAQFTTNRNTAVSRGFVYVHTNTGHWIQEAGGPGTAQFATDPTAFINWAYQAVHDTIQYAKIVAREYYGHAPLKSYFEGCSTGGRQALTEVQRYPNDFDGVVAGAPANLGTYLYFQGVWDAQQYWSGPFFLQQAHAVWTSLMQRCGEVDNGVPMGLIADPRSCKYIPATDGATFSAAQNQAYQRIITGAVNSRERLSYGPALGSEIAYNFTVPPGSQDIGVYYTLSLNEYAQGFLQYMASWQEPGTTFTMSGFNFETDPYRMAPVHNLLDVGANPDLSTYAARGGKVLLFHGWADPLIPTGDSVWFTENVYNTMGWSAGSNVLRSFLVPGMGHCGDTLGGTGGPDTFDMITPLVDWVEGGIAPSRIVASGLTHNIEPGWPFGTPAPVPVFTRPLCVYPYTAQYVSGVPFQESSFTCAPGLTGYPNPIAVGANSRMRLPNTGPVIRRPATIRRT